MHPQRPLPVVAPASDERRRERALVSLFEAAHATALARYERLADLPAYGRGRAMTTLGRATLADLFREEMTRCRADEGARSGCGADEGARSSREGGDGRSRSFHGDAAPV